MFILEELLSFGVVLQEDLDDEAALPRKIKVLIHIKNIIHSFVYIEVCDGILSVWFAIFEHAGE